MKTLGKAPRPKGTGSVDKGRIPHGTGNGHFPRATAFSQQESTEKTIDTTTPHTGTKMGVTATATMNREKPANTAETTSTGDIEGLTIAGQIGSPGTTVGSRGMTAGTKTVKSGCDETELKFATFNCHGLKSSFNSVLRLLEEIDVIFLCETRVKPSELAYFKNIFISQNRVS